MNILIILREWQEIRNCNESFITFSNRPYFVTESTSLVCYESVNFFLRSIVSKILLFKGYFQRFTYLYGE